MKLNDWDHPGGAVSNWSCLISHVFNSRKTVGRETKHEIDFTIEEEDIQICYSSELPDDPGG